MEKSEKKALIMMATYNGEETICEQLDSIQSQDFQNWELYISDDNSSDKTREIIAEYQQRDSRIKKILINKKFHGAYANYFNVLEYIKNDISNDYFDYYFYCDQDDRWVKNKMSKEIQVLENYGENEAILCYSDLRFMTNSGVIKTEKMSDKIDINLKNPYNLFFSSRYVWGTTMAHNKKLWDMLYINKDAMNNISHDTYIAQYAVCFGKIIYIDEPLVLYRRHEKNVSGIPGNYGLVEIMKKLTVKLPGVIKNHSMVYLEDLYFINNAPYITTFMHELKECILKGGIVARNFLKKYDIKTTSSVWGQLSLKIILYTGIYKTNKLFREIKDEES